MNKRNAASANAQMCHRSLWLTCLIACFFGASGLVASADPVTLKLTIGDMSKTHVEKYALWVGDQYVAMTTVSDTDYVIEGTIQLEPGVYSGHIQALGALGEHQPGDYDAFVSVASPNGAITISDTNSVLGSRRNTGLIYPNSSAPFQITVSEVPSGTPSGQNQTANENKGDSNSTDPINMMNGNVSLEHTDLFVPAPGLPLEFERWYNSRSVLTNTGFGPCWAHTYSWYVEIKTNTLYKGQWSDWKVLHDPLGEDHWFWKETATSYYYLAVGTGVEHSEEGGKDVFAFPGAITRTFDSNGVLETVDGPSGNTLTMTYAGSYPTQRLTQVRHDNGQALSLDWTDDRITQVTSPTNALAVAYAYNPAGELTNVIRTASGISQAQAYLYDTGYHSITQYINALGDCFNYGYEYVLEYGATNARGVSMNLPPGNYYQHSVDYTNSGENCTQLTYERGDTNQVYLYEYDPLQRRITSILGPGETNLGVNMAINAWIDDTEREYFNDTTGGRLRQLKLYDRYHNVHRAATLYGPGDPSETNWWWCTWAHEVQAPELITDPEGHKQDYTYTNGCLAKYELHYNSSGDDYDWRYSYTTNGLLSCVTNANGHWAEFYYDQYGFPTSAVPQTGPTVNYQYSQLGHLTDISMPGDSGTRTTSLDVNELGWVNSITYPNSLSESFLYDAIGNLTNHTDTAGRQTRYTYLPTRKLSSVLRPLSSGATLTNSVAYDQQFNTLNITDAKGRQVECYQLDIEDRPVSVTNLEGQTMTIAYAIGDYVAQITRFDSTVVTNSYNTDGLLSSMAFPGTTNTFTYLKNGLLRTAANETCSLSNTWSYANRLTNVTLTSDFCPLSSVSYSHHPAGQVSNVISVAGTNTYSLDEADRLSSLSASLVSLAPLVFNFSYNTNNGLVSSMVSTNSGVFAEYSFDNMDRLTNLVWKNASSNVIRSFAYAYNNASMITNTAREDGFGTSYSYDDLDQLISESGDGSTRQYACDQVGNRTQKVCGASTVAYTYSNGCNRLTAWSATGGGHLLVGGSSTEVIGTNPYLGQRYLSNSVSGCSATPEASGTNFLGAFPVVEGTQQVIAAIGDEAGNAGYTTNTITVEVVTNASYGYSAAGCVTSIVYSGSGFTNTTALTWNGLYRLTEVKTNGVAVEQNGFDAFGRRVWNWDGATTNYFVYDGAQIVADVNSTGGLVRSYVWGPGIDNLLAMTVYTGATAQTYYPLTDHQGTIHALVNSSGAVVESYRFDAWGRVLGVFDSSALPIPHSAFGLRYLWQGREYSWNTGLYYFRARWYDPITGRWLSNDPIGISGGLNQYVFCANNPLNFGDPFGYCGGDPEKTTTTASQWKQEKPMSCVASATRYVIFRVTGKNIAEEIVRNALEGAGHDWTRHGSTIGKAVSVLATYGVNAQKPKSRKSLSEIIRITKQKGWVIVAVQRPATYHAVVLLPSQAGGQGVLMFDPWTGTVAPVATSQLAAELGLLADEPVVYPAGKR